MTQQPLKRKLSIHLPRFKEKKRSNPITIKSHFLSLSLFLYTHTAEERKWYAHFKPYPLPPPFWWALIGQSSRDFRDEKRFKKKREAPRNTNQSRYGFHFHFPLFIVNASLFFFHAAAQPNNNPNNRHLLLLPCGHFVFFEKKEIINTDGYILFGVT